MPGTIWDRSMGILGMTNLPRPVVIYCHSNTLPKLVVWVVAARDFPEVSPCRGHLGNELSELPDVRAVRMLSHDVDKVWAELQHVLSCRAACHLVVVSCVGHLNDDKDLTTITTGTLRLLQTSSTSATKGVCQTLTPL